VATTGYGSRVNIGDSGINRDKLGVNSGGSGANVDDNVGGTVPSAKHIPTSLK